MHKKWLLSLFLIIGITQTHCQSNENTVQKSIMPIAEVAAQDSLLDSLLTSALGQELVGKYLQEKEAYQLQIIYTKIDRDAQDQPQLTSYVFGVNSEQYFYPASTVKLPLALLALEKMHKIGNIDLNTPFQIPALKVQETLNTAIRKALIVSDNPASNYLYDFLGREYIHQTLAEKGYKNIQILHRLGIPISEHKNPENQKNNAVLFFQNSSKNVLYEESARIDSNTYILDNKPEKYRYSNQLPLEELHQCLIAIFFPKTLPFKKQFIITEKSREFLWNVLGTYPKENQHPSFLGYIEKNQYPDDSYRKYFLIAEQKSAPENLRIYNKVGLGFAYITETAYVVNFEKNTEFLLSTAIFVRQENYADALQFVKKLGLLIETYETERFRKYPPKLENLQNLPYGD